MVCHCRKPTCGPRAELWKFKRKKQWQTVGPSVRIVLLPGAAPQPVPRLRSKMLEGRLAALLLRPPGSALGFVGLEAAEAAYVRASAMALLTFSYFCLWSCVRV